MAISTAILPPLANTGLCLALGAYKGASGSFLLFLANFLSILLISSVVFIAAGLTPRFKWKEASGYARHFGIAVIGFIVVAVLLTYSLVGIVKARHVKNSIKNILQKEFSELETVSFDRYAHEVKKDKVSILATVRSRQILQPNQVKEVQDELTEKLKKPAELIVRSVQANDIGATGFSNQVIAKDLDGFSVSTKKNPSGIIAKEAEQVLREKVQFWPGLQLVDIDYEKTLGGSFIVATTQGLRTLTPTEIINLEESIQERLSYPNIRLIVRSLTSELVDQYGRIHLGWTNYEGITPEKLEEKMNKISDIANNIFLKYPDVFLSNVDYDIKSEPWKVLIETVGARVMLPDEVKSLEMEISEMLNQQIKVYVWSKIDAMVTDAGFVSFEDFTMGNTLEREIEMREYNLNE